MNARFWAARQKRNLTQEALALEAEINQADVSRVEKQGWIPPRDVRERLAGILQVPADELFGHIQELAS